MLIFFIALGWFLAGMLFVAFSKQRKTIEWLELKLDSEENRNFCLHMTLGHAEDEIGALSATLAEAYQSRDDALRCLELVINEASTEELSR